MILIMLAGIDNALRLVQSIALIISSRTGSPEWTIVFEQLDYGAKHHYITSLFVNVRSQAPAPNVQLARLLGCSSRGEFVA